MHQRTVVLENGWLYQSTERNTATCTPLRGQHTLAFHREIRWSVFYRADCARRSLDISGITSCFPFNCRHEHVREHQNSVILSADDKSGKDGGENNMTTTAR